MIAGIPRNTSVYAIARARIGKHARPGSRRTTATSSAHTSTRTSATMNNLMFNQNARSNAVRLSHMNVQLNMTCRTLPSLRARSNATNATMSAVSPRPTTTQMRSRESSIATRAS
jgi:hypothetical protein